MIEEVHISSSLATLPMPLHDVGVSPHRDRRRFTAAFKLKILEEAARCVESGALGALLRREGLYSSHLAAWRAAAKAAARAEHAEALVELQKKVAELLGRTLPTAAVLTGRTPRARIASSDTTPCPPPCPRRRGSIPLAPRRLGGRTSVYSVHPVSQSR